MKKSSLQSNVFRLHQNVTRLLECLSLLSSLERQNTWLWYISIHIQNVTRADVSQNILFSVNVQHDCQTAKCSATGMQIQQQEQQDSGVKIPIIEHTGLPQYIINTHALHNTHLIRDALPCNLTKPTPYFKNQCQTHDELAAKLRATQETKRAATKAKQAAGRVKKKTSHGGKPDSMLVGGEGDMFVFPEEGWEEQAVAEPSSMDNTNQPTRKHCC